MPQTSVYAKRTGIAAPLEPDSDSDFNPGKFVDETDNKNKSKKNTRRKRIRARAPVRPASRVLQGIFGDLNSRSDEEQGSQDKYKRKAPDTDEEDEQEEDEPIGLPKSILPFFEKRHKKYVESLDNDSETEESVTEPESDVGPPQLSKRKLPCAEPEHALKRPKTLDDSSVTESETEEEIPLIPPTQTTTTNKAIQEDDSVTEPESDDEAMVNLHQARNPRPSFAHKLGQALKGPLILDPQKRISVPASINMYLRDYQRKGIQFFYRQYDQGMGGVLGDDMGLGKTIQVISFLSAIMRKHGDDRDEDRRRQHVSKLQDSKEWKQGRRLPAANATWPTCLIIVPSSVIDNWRRELDIWGYFEVISYVGLPKERAAVLKDFKLGRIDIVLTSHETARGDIEELEDLPFSCIFIDEAHKLKNMNSQTAIAYERFSCMRRFALTGTIIQNDYNEMWALFNWCNPGSVGTFAEWKKYVSIPLKAGQSSDASEEAQRKQIEVMDRFQEILLPRFFLRRTKELIKDQIPIKTDSVVFCPLSSIQIAVYKRILCTKEMENIIQKDMPCPCGSKHPRKKCCLPFNRDDVLRFISVLIKLSNHLALILPSPHDNEEQRKRHRELSEKLFADGHAPTYVEAQMRPEYCGKWGVLHGLLTDWRKDKTNKVLIFTKSTKLVEILNFYLQSQNYAFVTLTGDVPQKDRMKLVDSFQTDPDVFVFLISTLAGGTGLNLTAANKVVIFDPNWNPAHDLQAMDRAHRYGQTRDVSVFRLLGAGSIEELIYARQVYKQQQMAIGYDASIQTRYFAGVQGDPTKQGELFGLKNIFKLHEEFLETKSVIEKASLIELDWAFKNVKQDPSLTKTNGLKKADIEAMESSATKEDSAFSGLASLLFEDIVEPAKKQGEEALANMYTHQNNQVLAPNPLEEERARKLRARKPRSSKGQRSNDGWPPIRRHKKALPLVSDDERKTSRISSLILLGRINSPDQLGEFAQSVFAKMTAAEKEEFIAKLDRIAVENGF